jgi:5-formyltetrahydrofolate cyclo-ligase
LRIDPTLAAIDLNAIRAWLMADSKARLRQQLLAERQALHDHQRARLDRKICAYLLRFLDDIDAIRLGAFFPFRCEPNLIPAMEVLHQAARRIHLPVIRGEALDFKRWRPDVALRANRFGIPEPAGGDACEPGDLDVVFMPLVAFSHSGERLGMGGGFYDRALAPFIEHPGTGPQRVGVAYDFQQIDSLPVDAWDVPLDAVITDQGSREFTR